MERTLFDTNVFVAALNPREAHHTRAREILATTAGAAFTDDVFDELSNILTRNLHKEQAILAIQGFLASGVELLHVNEQQFHLGWNIYRTVRPLSFTDATNIAVMKSLGITRIATFDEAFKKIPGIEVIS